MSPVQNSLLTEASMFQSERLLPAIALFVLSAMCALAIETSETLTVDGKPPSERLSLALNFSDDPETGATGLSSTSITLDSR